MLGDDKQLDEAVQRFGAAWPSRARAAPPPG